MDMEKLLTGLFDFQRFERNPDLQSLIDEVEGRYGVTEVTDDELEMLAAAGDPLGQEYIPKNEDRVT